MVMLIFMGTSKIIRLTLSIHLESFLMLQSELVVEFSGVFLMGFIPTTKEGVSGKVPQSVLLLAF